MANFKKIITFLVLFTVLHNFNAYSEVVNKVAVQGNNRISSETIMIFGDIEIGKNSFEIFIYKSKMGGNEILN